MKRLTMILLCSIAAGCSAGTGAQSPLTQQPQSISAYTIAPDDKVKIGVYGEEALTGEYVVREDGTISFPLIGVVKANGLTLSQLQAQLTQQLANGLLQDPRVTAEIVEYRPFYILGEVGRAGQYPYKIGMTVNAAVATAGGFSYRANKKTVAIQHRGENEERKYKLTSSLQIKPGDTVRVLERFF